MSPGYRASIDLGTNTCLLLIAEWDAQSKEIVRAAADFSTIVRLGQGVDQTRALHPAAMERTLACLKTYARELQVRGLDPREALCVATSQARDASNGREFFAKVEAATGFRFKIITGDEEARCTFLGGLLPGMDPAAYAVIDIGGGSTEVIAQDGGQSVDLGSVRFTERYLRSNPVTDAEFWECQSATDSLLEPLKAWRAKHSGHLGLVAVAGTATTLAAWHLGLKSFDAAQIDRLELTRGDVHRMVEELKWRTIEERCSLPGMEPKRADVLLAGALILWRAMEELNFPQCRVSTRGLRYGVLRALC